jgi:2-hydroxychromene-2-carboxylate isomerase
MHHVDFYFDFSSPFAYLGATQIEKIVARAGATMTWKPMFLGGVFKAVETPLVPFFKLSEEKRAYIAKDMQRWAQWWDVPFNFPSQFPMMTVKPLRMCLTLDDPSPFIQRVFAAYWSEGLDISNEDVLRQCCKDISIDPETVTRAGEPQVKAQLQAATAQAVHNGVFGAPTSIVNGHLFWGQDRLEMVEKALGGWVPPSLED